MKICFTVFLPLIIITATAFADIPYLNKNRFNQLVNEGYSQDNYENVQNQDQPYQEDAYSEDSYSNDGYAEPENGYGEVPQQPVCERPSQRQIEEDKIVARQAYQMTEGACDFRNNPHSYACTHITFNQLLFPFFEIDWWGDLGTPWNMQGEWIVVTYVESNGKENEGDAFYMQKNPHSPTQPLGVQNRNFGPMGSMWIEGELVRFENWQGKQMWSRPGSLEIYRDHVLFQMDEQIPSKKKSRRMVDVVHYFDCVNFNRHNNMHLQCSWDVKIGRSARTHMGYFGYLTKSAWDGFLTCHKR